MLPAGTILDRSRWRVSVGTGPATYVRPGRLRYAPTLRPDAAYFLLATGLHGGHNPGAPVVHFVT